MPFSFNAYSALLLPFFVQGVVVSVVLLARSSRHGTAADVWLAVLLLLNTLHLAQWMLGFAGWYDSHDACTTFMFYFPFSHWLAVGPALYFYFRSLTNQQFTFRLRDGRHFLPLLLVLAVRLLLWVYEVLLQYKLRGQPLPEHFGTKGRLAAGLEQANVWLGLEMLGYASVAVYAWLTLRDYRLYRRYINDNFSDTEHIRFVWLRNLLVAVLAGVGVTFLFRVVDTGVVALSYYQAWYEYLLTGILIYFLSIAGLLTNHQLAVPLQFQPEPAALAEQAAVPLEVAEAAKVAYVAPEALPAEVAASLPLATASTAAAYIYAPETVAPAAAEAAPDVELLRWTARLTRHMETQRPYLSPELTLGELAAQLRTNTSQLSRVINTGCRQNFNDYVNTYRVREAERLLREPRYRHYTLLAIALESGFNSKSTFNRVFKKLRGLTPSEAARQE